jgi:hypothetical protein
MTGKFGYTLKIIYNKVMSILDKLKQNNKASETDAFSLSKQEIEFLLLLIKDANFKGEHVELLYSLVYKLQQQYQSK